MSANLKVTTEKFLAYAVPLERRRIQEERGAVEPFPALPPCPACSQPVTSVVERSRLRARYSIGLGCHRLVSVVFSDEIHFNESLLAKARKIAASLEDA